MTVAEAHSLSLSVVIPTKDRENILRQTLVTIFLQSRRPDELIIVDDGRMDGDDLCAWVQAHGISCAYYRKETPGLTASRNLAVGKARGDVLLFLDDDVILERDYIAEILALFEADVEGKVGGATGALRVDYDRGVRAFLQFFMLDGKRPGAVLPSGAGVLVRQGEISETMDVEWLSGCNMAYRRQVFEDFRFDQRLGSYGWGEDRDFSYRVGKAWRLLATPNARLIHLKELSGRIDERRMGFMEMNYLYKFFATNMPKRPRDLAAIGWAELGVAIRNLLLLLQSNSRAAAFRRLGGNLAGFVAIFTGADRV